MIGKNKSIVGSRKVVKLDKNGNIIEIFNSVTNAYRNEGIMEDKFRKLLQKKIENTFNEFTYEYYNEYQERMKING